MKQDVTAHLGKCKYCGHRFLPGIEGTLDGTICYEHEYIEEPVVEDYEDIKNGEQKSG